VKNDVKSATGDGVFETRDEVLETVRKGLEGRRIDLETVSVVLAAADLCWRR